MDVVFYRGEFLSARDVHISLESRAFNYGDGFFETIKIINSLPFNFHFHMQRIKFALNTLNIVDEYSSQFFMKKFKYLLDVNRVKNGSIKIHISRRGIGKYLPKSNNSDVLISVLNGSKYIKNDPISLCCYDEQLKSISSLSNIKSSNSLVSVLASIYASENNFDNSILLNNSLKIIESSNSNIFILKDEKLYTPPISDGCVDGTMRKWVLSNLNVSEKSMLKDEIFIADEIFLTNSTFGCVPVKKVDKISFSSFSTSDSLQKMLINLG